jgi:TRAP-type C4-dicarboxylate transport system permease large subunit
VKDIMPFLLAMVLILILITFVPEIVLWLPRRFGYQG